MPTSGRRRRRVRLVEVGAPHVERVAADPHRDLLHHRLDHRHPLRSAEAAKGGVGRQVGAADPRADLDRRQEVGVVGVEHGALEHRGREVGERAAVREEAKLRRHDAPVADRSRRDTRCGTGGASPSSACRRPCRRRRAPGARCDRPPAPPSAPGSPPASPCRRSRRPCAAPGRPPGAGRGRAPRPPRPGSRSGSASRSGRRARPLRPPRPAPPGSRGRTAPGRRSRTRLRPPGRRRRTRRRDRRARCGARRRGRDHDASASSIESTGGSSSMSRRTAARAARAAPRVSAAMTATG